ncbi:hypothetical protein GCM10010869_08870 [Mesorhizobium tianshanense]|uniref:ParB family chromosome partitioning protein n=1 Tax=Mesorhizobium tianshanense TaxID=39844 RepID=A0A562NBT8_9HYPH|nr:ParB family chromosome partitioning protein [Mesorhizobium tianshanense]GLS35299.1 hypothetical protein GCM10010869_08870 [Mesorhizobium tianshanense]
MELKFVDPRALKDNPDKARRSKSSPQGDALLLATIRAVGIVQPPVVAPEADGGNGYVIDAGHRRVRQGDCRGFGRDRRAGGRSRRGCWCNAVAGRDAGA